MHETTLVTTANVDLGNVVTASGDTATDPLEVDRYVSCADKNKFNAVA